MKPYAEYFDDDGKQLEPLPNAWIEMTGWKIGDKIEWLRDGRVMVPDENGEPRETGFGGQRSKERYVWKDRRGMIGVVEGVRRGMAQGFPSWWSDEYECWFTQSPGSLVVRFPGTVHFDSDGNMQAICLHPQDEGVEWRRVKGVTRGARREKIPGRRST